MESPEINPGLCSQLIFDTGGKSIQWSKDSLFNTWHWENRTGTRKKEKEKESRPPSYTIHHNEPKMDKRLN